MYLNDLANIARSAGLPVIEVAGWQGRNHGSLANVQSVVCHHTAGPAVGNYPSLGVVTNGRSDLAGPLAQLGLGRDGTVYIISNGVAWHAGATINDSLYGNSHAIGIEAENTGTGQPWPDVQVRAYAKLCAALCRAYGLPVSRIVGHKEICKPAGRKIDPFGLPGDMSGLRALAATYMTSGGGGGAGGGTTPTPTPTVRDEEDEMQPVTLDKAPTQVFKSFIWDGRKAVLNIISNNEDVFIGRLMNWGPAGGTGGGNPTTNLPTVPGGWRVTVNQPGQFDIPAGTTRVVLPYSTNAAPQVQIVAV
jgi:hypothetical protein